MVEPIDGHASNLPHHRPPEYKAVSDTILQGQPLTAERVAQELGQGALWGGYLFNQQRLPLENRMSPLVGEFGGADEAAFQVCFLNWVKAQKLDAVIVTFNQAVRWLEAAGKRVPGDIAVAHMGLGPDVPEWSGVSFQDAEIGGAAIDLLTAHIMRNEYGLPRHPKLMRIAGEWHDGETTTRPKGQLRAFLPASQSHSMEWFESEFWSGARVAADTGNQ